LRQELKDVVDLLGESALKILLAVPRKYSISIKTYGKHFISFI
jgi:hypothetical protein